MAGILKQAGDFLGVSKFGKGLASSARVLTGEVDQDIANQSKYAENKAKLLYAARQEQDPARKQKLLTLASNLGTGTSAAQIDPGLNLSNREILGSAANVGLNILTPGAFKGTKAAIIGKNALLGGAFGAASGLEKNRSVGGVIGSTLGGAAIGAGLGTAAVAAKAFRDFSTVATPKWLMDKAIKPTLDEARKSIKYGNKSLGEELLKEGVKGSPQKLLEIAATKLDHHEEQLQSILSAPKYADKFVEKSTLLTYAKDLVEQKSGVPGLSGDIQRIKNVFDALPERLSLPEANVMKRRIYTELRDVSYKLDSRLSTKAASLKLIARGLKEQIEKIAENEGVAAINQKLSIYGRLEKRITDQMARSMRNNSFGLTDAILTSGGIASLHPAGLLGGLTAAGVKHAAGSTTGRTFAAQGLAKLQEVGTGKVAQTLKGAARRAILNAP